MILKMSNVIAMGYASLVLCIVVSVKSDNCLMSWMKTGHEVAESQYLIDLSVKNTQHGMATTYFPDTQYDIIIRPKRETLTFKEFIFKMMNVNNSMSYGSLELREPGLSKFSEEEYCINRVVNLANMAKPNITIGWQSPTTKSGCIVLQARVKETDLRYHSATLSVCEDPRIELDNPGKTLETCCACPRAKYEMTFEGTWSKFNHPRGFPKKDWLAGFPTVVGAAHDPHYEIWQKYKHASDGLKIFAESGSSLALELELKAHSDNITTFIKFRGTNFKNRTLARAQLRVDRLSHVVSLVAKINPSPDWFIGVSNLELCKEDCTWMDNQTLNLYAYDAGSMSGLEFEQENNRITHDVINPMNMSWPMPDKRSTPPFYDKTNNTHEVRPMAQIHLKLIRAFGTTCPSTTKNKTIEVDESCVTEWHSSHQCTVTCGPGFIVHSRQYKEGYNGSNCLAELDKRIKCGNENIKCEDAIDEETCEMTEWSGWRKCAQPCGQESTMRTRNYKLHKYEDKCSETFPDNSLSEYKDCGHPPCPGEIWTCNDDLYGQWSGWTDCSVTIGRGLKYRRRKKLAEITSKELYNNDAGFGSCLYDKLLCDGVDPKSVTPPPVLDLGMTTTPRATLLYGKAAECLLPEDPGIACTGQAGHASLRYVYVQDTTSCEQFSYHGCAGNANNFNDELDCKQRCIAGLNVDCKLSEWSVWSGCNNRRCQTQQKRTRSILVYPTGTGKPCPQAGRYETRQCPKNPQCQYRNGH